MKRAILNTICILCSVVSFAQLPAFYEFTTEDGLPSNELHDLEFTEDGKLWLATNKGISVYDGVDFQNLSVADGLADNTIHAIFKDQRGRLWFVGYSVALTIYANGALRPYEYNSLIRSLTHSKSTFIDFLASDGQVYISLRGLPTLRIDRQGELSFPFESDRSCKRALRRIAGKYCMYTISDSDNDCLTSFLREDAPQKFSSVRDRREYSVELNGVTYFTVDGTRLYAENDTPAEPITSFPEGINALARNGDKLLVGTSSGLFQLSIDAASSRETLLSNRFITGIAQDQVGGIWVTTLYNGLCFIPNHQVKVWNAQSGMLDNRLTSIEEHDSIIVAGGLHGQINILSPIGKVTHYATYEGLQGVIRDIDWLPGRGFLIASAGPMLHVLNPDDLSLQIIHDEQWKTGTVRRLCVDRGNVWLAGNSGLHSIDTVNNGSITATLQMADLNGLSLHVQNARDAYVGTPKGLFRVDMMHHTLENLSALHPALKSRVVDIDEWRGKAVLFATEGAGLAILYKDSLIVINDSMGLASNNLTCIDVVDRDVFIGTEKGLDVVHLSWVHPLKFTIRHYDRRDGLSSNYVTDIDAGFDRVWLTTNEGLNRVDLNSMPVHQQPPIVQAASLRVNGKKYSASGRIVLPHDSSDLSISAEGIYTYVRNDLTYHFRMEGALNRQVQSEQSEFHASYLPAGDYVFYVKACNHYGVCSEELQLLEATILDPLWKRPWFITLEVLIGLTLVVMFIRYRDQRNLKRLQVEEEQTRKSIQAELKALRAQLNPHFVANVLTNIQDSLLQGDTLRSSSNIAKLGKLMRNLLDSSRLELVTIKEELDAIRNYLELERQILSVSFEYEIEVGDVDVEATYLPSMLLQPYVENAVVHGFKKLEREGYIRIAFELRPDGIRCIIEDNGVGRSKEERKGLNQGTHRYSWGNMINSERIELISKLNKRTVRTIYEDLEHADGSAVGTRVCIDIPALKAASYESV